MKKVKSRLLVIDASVARAAGLSEHPRSSACRNFLKAVLEICHRVAVSEEILAEWNNHQSRYTRKWRCSMAARRKPLKCIMPIPSTLKFQDFATDQWIEIEKDLCLLEAALAADREIVTLDDDLITALESTPKGLKFRNRFIWHHPERDGTDGIEI